MEILKLAHLRVIVGGRQRFSLGVRRRDLELKKVNGLFSRFSL